MSVNTSVAKVENYYQQNFSKLNFDKQWHFVSRLYLWDRDNFAQEKVELLHDPFLKGRSREIEKKLASYLSNKRRSQIVKFYEVRKPYLEIFPQIYNYCNVLFARLFAETIYRENISRQVRSLLSDSELTDFARKLIKTPKSIAFLSTSAVNFLYLLRFHLEGDFKISLELFDEAQALLNTTDYAQRQLLLYLITHTIIGDSGFYYRRPHGFYKQYLFKAEAIIAKHFSEISLDLKNEYLVCCRLLEYQSKLQTQIMDEAVKSFAQEGDYLIDMHNQNRKPGRNDINNSEHRNVLFIMQAKKFTPLAEL